MASRPLSLYHERTRRRGVNSLVYWPMRWVVKAAILVYFRLRRLGTEHIPEGGVILASNHRSFLDPFAIGCCLGRPIYFVAKQELFKNPLLGWVLNCLGAFPIRRGAADEESVATSLALLERGEAVVIFPEGTRIRTGSLAPPKRGVGRLALQSGSPVVPIAVTNSERARRGWRIKPVKVHIRFGPPVTFPRVEDPSPFLAGEVTERIWPCVGLQWEWLGGLPPLRTAAVVGAGSMGTAAAGEIGARVGDRSAVLVTSKGLVPPLGTTPAAFVSERVRARAVATLAGPAHAREAIELGACVVLATRDADLRRQLHDMLEAGGLTLEAPHDVTGTGFAARAKNAPALAGAGDLVATAIAEGSRNRRAGEMVGAGVPAGQVQASMDQTAESLATVPLLGVAFERQGIDAPVTTGLRRVLDGESSPEQWLESVRSARPARRRTHAA